MSFYVTLPSNSSMNFYPDNTLTHFITKLHQPLQLIGTYEVALSEIIFPFNWIPNLKGTIEVGQRVGKEPIITTINMSDVIPTLKSLSMNSLTLNINGQLNTKKLKSSMSYNENNNRISLEVHETEYMHFSDELKTLFGLPYNLFEVRYEKTEQRPRHLNNINNVYVYCDCIDYQYVGDSFTPLLRVVAVSNDLRYGDYLNVSYDSPHYVPVSRNTINTVEITLRTDTGEPIKFNYGKVLVKLHFRPKAIY